MLLDREEDDFPASNAYGISRVPTMFLVERGGTVARVIEGWSQAGNRSGWARGPA